MEKNKIVTQSVIHIITQNDAIKTLSIPIPLPTSTLLLPLILPAVPEPPVEVDVGEEEVGEDEPLAANPFALARKASKVLGPDSTTLAANTMPLLQ